ncbi:Protein W06D4.3 [Aphelenchoides avenae]|nr:Protein W06D4.3 [Aphelenchus avenae]
MPGRRTPSPNARAEEVDAAQHALSEKKKKRGMAAKLFLRAAEVLNVVEQTHLAPEFQTEIKKYHDYNDRVDSLVSGLEGVLQMNPAVLVNGRIEASERRNPYEILAKSMKHFRHFCPADKKAFVVLSEAITKRFALLDREMQVQGRFTIRKLRRFVSHEYHELVEDQRKLSVALELMDEARHKVKQSKTKEILEWNGRVYERAVYEFDQQASQVNEYCELLPQSKEHHQQELLQWFGLLHHHHKQCAVVIADNLAKHGNP